MTVISISARRKWIPIVRCTLCDNDRAATGKHVCRPETPAAPDLSTAGSR